MEYKLNSAVFFSIFNIFSNLLIQNPEDNLLDGIVFLN